MKITRRKLRRLIKEFRDFGSNDYENININVPPVPPDSDEGGGEGKDWSAELIKRLHKKGFDPLVNNRGYVLNKTAKKVFNLGECMLLVEDLGSNDGVVVFLHARNYVSDANQTDAERMQFGPTIMAASKFMNCDNGMDVNNIIRRLLRINKKISNMTGDMIFSDLKKLKPSATNDEIDEFDMNAILNSDDQLIDYYAR